MEDIFRRVLQKQRNWAFAAVVALPYKKIAWRDRNPTIEWPDDVPLGTPVGDSAFAPPVVAMVTKGTMEIYETDKTSKGTQRRKTTVVLRPGGWFGLFEAYARWRGDWTITSGVVSFIICNTRIGTADGWHLKRGQALNYQHRDKSKLQYENLVPEVACESWLSESVWMRPDLVQDPNLRLEIDNLLKDVTIDQLVSALKQSATWGQIGQGDKPDDDALWFQYLDSVIDEHTPIFQLVDLNDETYFPVKAAVENLSTNKKLQQSQWHILVPRILEGGCIGIHLSKYVSRFPPKAEERVLSLNAKGIAIHATDYGRTMTLMGESSTFHQTIKYRNATVQVYCPHRSDKATKINPIALLTKSAQTDNWPKYFDTVVIIDKSI
ncbi:MAG: hypothetical protein KGJ40_02045 [candidate division NC10 bacterium]|nr:hypothetical protein [candidate division NC10 bacterium]